MQDEQYELAIKRQQEKLEQQEKDIIAQIKIVEFFSQKYNSELFDLKKYMKKDFDNTHEYRTNGTLKHYDVLLKKEMTKLKNMLVGI